MKPTITRKEFIKTGSKGLAVTALMPFALRCAPGTMKQVPKGGSMQLADYMKHFGVDEKVINNTMAAALSRGGDYCDIYFEHSISNTVRLEDRAVNKATSNVDLGVGIRVLKGDQTGYSFTELLTPESMKQAALTAANIADSSNKNIDPVLFNAHSGGDYYPIGSHWELVSIDRKIPNLQNLSEYIFSLDNRIVKAGLRLSNSTSYVMVATSDGRISFDYRPMGQLSVNCTAESNGRKEKYRKSLSGRYGFEYFTKERSEKLADFTVGKTLELFDAIQPKAGEMEVVLAAGSSGILLHEAIGHGMEADFNRKGVSIFSDKINKPVAEKFVTIVDDGTNRNVRGSLNVDDEANDTEKTVLVQDGVMASYLHDRISAKHYGVKSTGSVGGKVFDIRECRGCGIRICFRDRIKRTKLLQV